MWIGVGVSTLSVGNPSTHWAATGGSAASRLAKIVNSRPNAINYFATYIRHEFGCSIQTVCNCFGNGTNNRTNPS